MQTGIIFEYLHWDGLERWGIFNDIFSIYELK